MRFKFKINVRAGERRPVLPQPRLFFSVGNGTKLESQREFQSRSGSVGCGSAASLPGRWLRGSAGPIPLLTERISPRPAGSAESAAHTEDKNIRSFWGAFNFGALLLLLLHLRGVSFLHRISPQIRGRTRARNGLREPQCHGQHIPNGPARRYLRTRATPRRCGRTRRRAAPAARPAPDLFN